MSSGENVQNIQADEDSMNQMVPLCSVQHYFCLAGGVCPEFDLLALTPFTDSVVYGCSKGLQLGIEKSTAVPLKHSNFKQKIVVKGLGRKCICDFVLRENGQYKG